MTFEDSQRQYENFRKSTDIVDPDERSIDEKDVAKLAEIYEKEASEIIASLVGDVMKFLENTKKSILEDAWGSDAAEAEKIASEITNYIKDINGLEWWSSGGWNESSNVNNTTNMSWDGINTWWWNVDIPGLPPPAKDIQYQDGIGLNASRSENENQKIYQWGIQYGTTIDNGTKISAWVAVVQNEAEGGSANTVWANVVINTKGNVKNLTKAWERTAVVNDSVNDKKKVLDAGNAEARSKALNDSISVKRNIQKAMISIGIEESSINIDRFGDEKYWTELSLKANDEMYNKIQKNVFPLKNELVRLEALAKN